MMRHLLIFILLLPSLAFAWGRTGHQVVAQIAYDNLTPKAKQRADKLLTVLDPYYPKHKGFVRASTWADSLRGHDMMAFNRWHYINKPIYASRGVKPIKPSSQNIVWGIGQASYTLGSKKSNDFEKALMLRFYIHMLGDIHQPLHCASRVSAKYPKGDKGGHYYKVKSKWGSNLHSVWDRGLDCLDRYPRKDRVKKLAADLQRQFPKSMFKTQLKQTEPKEWANEGYYLARDFVYKTPMQGALSKGYRKQACEIIDKQLALAGYRLAAGLNTELQ